MVNEKKKKIKILSRGIVLTSRGMARTPIDRPYLETVNTILLLITRYNADIVEVLPDGREVKLTIKNFNIDNSNVNKENEKDEVVPEVKPEPTIISKNMSRKERKRLETERRKADQQNVTKSSVELNENIISQENTDTKETSSQIDATTNNDNTENKTGVNDVDVIKSEEKPSKENNSELDEVPVE